MFFYLFTFSCSSNLIKFSSNKPHEISSSLASAKIMFRHILPLLVVNRFFFISNFNFNNAFSLLLQVSSAIEIVQSPYNDCALLEFQIAPHRNNFSGFAVVVFYLKKFVVRHFSGFYLKQCTKNNDESNQNECILLHLLNIFGSN